MTDKLRCVVLDDFQSVALTSADWTPIHDYVETVSVSEHPDSEEALIELLSEADIVVTLRERIKFPRRVLARLPRLRLLVTTGMRNSVIDMEAARDLGIVVSGTASSLTPPTELTWALILGLARHLPVEDREIRSGGWQTTVGHDLHGSTLGVVGLGRIGAAVAKVGIAFGMHVIAWSKNLIAERCEEVGVQRAASLPELLAASDIITIHLKLSDRTTGLIGADEFAAMRDSALLINTSRSAIIDRVAMLDTLREGRIGGAGLDVYDVEPLEPNDPLRTAPRTILTPHLGYVTRRNLRTYYSEAVEDIAAFISRSPIRVLNT